MAIRRGRLWVPRILSIRDHFPDVPAGEDPAYRLCLDNPGQISGLQMKTCEPAPLGPGMVEIDVKAAALNFRDVMATLGLLPPSAYEHSALGLEVGIEASGIVRRLGEGADYCRVGDEVIFTRGGCIANRMTLEKHFLFAKPARLSMEEAASSLSVYVTAYYALIHLARLGKGQRVLIHSAMGGVGQAAIALARHAGAEIYATAGSDAKRTRLLALGAKAAFDSHREDWYDEVMAATGGAGVDVVLNSLAGRHLELCLEALRPGGWHCEIGKVDIYSDASPGPPRLPQEPAIRGDRRGPTDARRSPPVARTLRDLPRSAGQGHPAAPAGHRLRLRGLREGLSPDDERPAPGKAGAEGAAGRGSPAHLPIADRRPLLDPGATYLVTGGLGGFGLCLLAYLVSAGARHLTLMDRDPHRRRSVEWVREASTLLFMDRECEIEIVAGDVAESADVVRCIANLARGRSRASSTSPGCWTIACSPTCPANPWRRCSPPRPAAP